MAVADLKTERDVSTPDHCLNNKGSAEATLDDNHKDQYSFADDIGAKYKRNEGETINSQSHFDTSAYQMAEDVPVPTTQNEYQSLKLSNLSHESENNYDQLLFDSNKKQSEKSDKTADGQKSSCHNKQSIELADSPHNLYSVVQK